MVNSAEGHIPGPVILFGSGETAPSGRRVYDSLFATLGTPVRAAILETPAGFEPNSPWVAQQVANFWNETLPAYEPRTAVIPARRKGWHDSPDNPALLTPLYSADVIFSGAGSPTYAVRQYRDSQAWRLLCAAHRLGSAIVLASASTLAASRYTLPVYEIYKVGEELHWVDGLDFFGGYGLELVFVPHWNNRDGGSILDTSRCYMGQSRFDGLHDMLPARSTTIVGIEEHTALWIDIAAAQCHVLGLGAVELILAGESRTFTSGALFPIGELGPFRPTGERLSADLTAEFIRARAGVGPPQPGPDVLAVMRHREEARAAREWQRADRLRDELLTLGWQVRDTPEGTVLEASESSAQEA